MKVKIKSTDHCPKILLTGELGTIYGYTIIGHSEFNTESSHMPESGLITFTITFDSSVYEGK